MELAFDLLCSVALIPNHYLREKEDDLFAE